METVTHARVMHEFDIMTALLDAHSELAVSLEEFLSEPPERAKERLLACQAFAQKILPHVDWMLLNAGDFITPDMRMLLSRHRSDLISIVNLKPLEQ